VGRLILVDEPAGTAGVCGRTAVYAWVSSADPKADLDWQVARATTQQTPVDLVVTDVGSALNGHRRRFLALLGDRSVDLIVVASVRLCRFGSEYVFAVLAARSTPPLALTARRRDGAF
jgi:predicted site-specific integrase-resolvase